MEDAKTMLDLAQKEWVAAKAEVARCQAALKALEAEAKKIAHQMRFSGEYDRRITLYNSALRRYEQEREKVRRYNRRIEDLGGDVYLLWFLLVILGGAVFIALLGMFTVGVVLIGIAQVLLFIIGPIILWRKKPKKEPPYPEPENFGLCYGQGGEWKTVEEERILAQYPALDRALHQAIERERKAEEIYKEAEEIYRVSLLSPAEQAAYWARKQYELEKKHFEELQRRVGEIEEQTYWALMDLEQMGEILDETSEVQEKIEEQQVGTMEEIQRLKEEIKKLKKD